MKKEIAFAMFVITILAFSSIAGVVQSQSSTANAGQKTPPPPTNQIDISSKNTESFSNTNLATQLANLVNSDKFKQMTAEWSEEKDTQDPGYRLEDMENTRGTLLIYGAGIDAYSAGPGPPIGANTGWLTNPNNLIGAPDNQYTGMHTEIWRDKPDGDEAIVIVRMQSNRPGDVWLRGYTNQYATSDVYVFGADDPNLNMFDWMGIGYAHFTSNSPQDVYVGTTAIGYKYLAVFAYARTDNPFTLLNDARVDSVVVMHSTSLPPYGVYVETCATADVLISPTQVSNGNNLITWVCGDDWGTHYCYVKEVIVDGVPHGAGAFGNAHSGSITFNDGQSHTVIVSSLPYYYPVTFNQYASNNLVKSWTEWRVHWVERSGPVYCTGSNLSGGGGEDYYVASTISWAGGSANFVSAVAYNWWAGSETYYYSIPLNVWTFVWGNTVDIWYS
ncbi:hypothetical protein [Candidatus Bathycorpusculum sp.]|uniref:hypothetical protein n=1 Tax=Candidatus Bathycorpusculum sp. TaxID=2994959 RepID=UPI0028338241|nr:hypothetical protein [Candidatus Termitimicrobium sp.]MCL2432687.1 hypothetical protein [Candidatus Termitimicrobium sp.]